jgi:hypothetical protein
MAAGLIAAAGTSAFAQSTGGLTASQQSALKQLRIPVVVPNPVPAGFAVSHVDADARANPNYYKIVYKRPSDGATIAFYGKAAEKKHHSIFQSIGSAFGGVKPSSNDNTSTQPEQEERMSDVVVDSDVVGPAHLNPDKSGCLAGSADTGKGSIKTKDGFAFSVIGCNMKRPDAITLVYRALTRMH